MKKHVQKAKALVENKKQMTFDVPDVPDVPKTEEKRKKTMLGKAKSTYWICVNSHVFKHKYQVHPDREKELKCPVCGKAVKNKTTETTYLYYLNKTGRGDAKKYRADEIKREKKEMEKKALFAERAGQEPDV